MQATQEYLLPKQEVLSNKESNCFRGGMNMALGKRTTIFVSSTCYDLKQIRNDIRLFFQNQLSYDVLLSEYDSFPLDPQVGTIDNCLRAVDERADIFVLIVGCRYGHITETGHSVTNMEYLRAKAKGIPIYAFVDKNILSILPLWRDNPNGNFQSTVDTPKLFEFVDTFRSNDGIWSFGFESAQDIINILRVQLSYLFSDCLLLKQKAAPQIMSRKIAKLDGYSFQIALLRPTGWEYKLFAQALSMGLTELKDRRRDFNFGITLASSCELQSIEELIGYISLKMQQLERAISTVSVLINKTLPEAFGESGVSGDADYILYAVNRLIEVYTSIIDWSLDFSTIVTKEIFSGIVNSFTKMCEVTLCDIENFSKDCCEKLQSVPDNLSESAEPLSITLTLTLRPPNTDEFYQELNALVQMYGILLEDE